MFRTLIAASLLMSSSTIALAQDAPAFQPTLSLSASANAEVTPDFATVSSGVVTRGNTAREALTQNSELMEGVFSALRRAGIDRSDMQTSQLSVSPVYSERRPNQTTYVREIIGYEARNTVSAKVTDLDRLGRVIDAMAEAGANNINGVSFGAENTDEAMDQARRDAVARLMSLANLYADAGGFELCGIRHMNEGHAIQPRPVRYEADMMSVTGSRFRSEAPPIAAGELSLTATVSATFCITQD